MVVGATAASVIAVALQWGGLLDGPAVVGQPAWGTTVCVSEGVGLCQRGGRRCGGGHAGCDVSTTACAVATMDFPVLQRAMSTTRARPAPQRPA